MKWIPAVVVASIVAVTGAACGDDSPSSPSSTGSRFVLRLSSSAFGSAPAVLVTFSRVRALHSSGGWVDVALPGGGSQFTCDLRKLQTSDGEIAVGGLPAGSYSEVRVTIQNATLYLDTTSNTTCAADFRAPAGRSTPVSGTPNEMALTSSFQMNAATDTTMRIALNSEASIRSTGGGAYTLQPVVTVLSVT